VANKKDLVRSQPELREVTFEEGQQLASRYGFNFIETSAMASENVQTAFEVLLNAITEVKKH
jgi:hypothetical protein